MVAISSRNYSSIKDQPVVIFSVLVVRSSSFVRVRVGEFFSFKIGGLSPLGHSDFGAAVSYDSGQTTRQSRLY